MVRQPHSDKVSMNNTLSTLLEQLHADGISCSLDRDGDIVFIHNGLSYALCLDPDDEHFGCLLLPRVWHVAPDQAAHNVLAALNLINHRLKLVKGVMSDGHVSFVIELWLPDPAIWRQCVGRARDTLVHAVHLFVDAMDGAKSGLQSPAGEDKHRT